MCLVARKAAIQPLVMTRGPFGLPRRSMGSPLSLFQLPILEIDPIHLAIWLVTITRISGDGLAMASENVASSVCSLSNDLIHRFSVARISSCQRMRPALHPEMLCHEMGRGSVDCPAIMKNRKIVQEGRCMTIVPPGGYQHGSASNCPLIVAKPASVSFENVGRGT